jgi:hypothetical protein
MAPWRVRVLVVGMKDMKTVFAGKDPDLKRYFEVPSIDQEFSSIFP